VVFHNGKERKEENGKGTEKDEEEGFLHIFLYIGLPPDVQKGCPFWITHEIFHFEGYY